MEKLSKFVISRLALRQQPSAGHPDADVLTAFAEGDLSAYERKGVLEHLGQCPACRDVVALAGESESFVPVAPLQKPHGRLWWRWAATAAVACLITAVVWRPEFIRVNPQPPPSSALAVTAPPVAAPLPPPVIEAKPQQRKTARKTVARVETPAVPEPKAAERAAITTTPAPSLPTARLLPFPQAQSFVTNASPRLHALTGNSGSLWRLPSSADENGMVQKSDDGGKTWENVRLSDQSKFYALSTSGPDIWAGGTEGTLFRSSDNGSHWTAVNVTDEATRLTGTITRIDVLSENTIRLQIQGSRSWITTDGGAHWYRE